jgi:para-nitrobenzyl esterase
MRTSKTGLAGVLLLAWSLALSGAAQAAAPLLYDAHAHLVADDLATYPRLPERTSTAGGPPPGIAGQPGGKSGPHPLKVAPDVSRMLVWMKQENVDGIVAVQKRVFYGYDNSYILDSAAAHPDQMAPVVVLDALDPSTPATVRDLALNHRLAGVRLAGGRDKDGGAAWMTSPQARKTWAVAEAFGLVVDLEPATAESPRTFIPDVLSIAGDYPHVRIVLDHLFQPDITRKPDYGVDAEFKKLAAFRNVYLKFTTINLDFANEADVDPGGVLKAAVAVFGADHVMWGSDVGTSAGTYHDMVARMLAAAKGLSARERAFVLHDTGKAVFVPGGTVKPKLSPVVATRSGPVQGFVADGAQQFLGIPYAAPPVGDQRWRPPAAPAAWTAVRRATAFGSRCPQGRDIGDFARAGGAEDCLYLNVFAPSASPDRPRAVLVWFPGGGMFAGDSADYDASLLASRGDLVVVTLNYRVGVLGFFAHPAIDGEGHASANYALMDQQAALKWVAQNIAAFGGDPARVTIGGQSAGGSSALMHLISPGSKGLFHGVIDQSGSRLAIPTRAQAQKTGEAFAAAAGCPDQSAACLRSLPASAIVARQQPYYVAVVLDGTVVPAQPARALESGAFNRVPVINGLAHDEQSFFVVAMAKPGEGPITAQGYADYVARIYGANAAKVLAAYPLAAYASPSQAQVAVVQGSKACTTRRMDQWLSKWTPTYAYQFDDVTVPSYLAPASFPLGAYHTAELLYLFPLFHGAGAAHALNPAQQKLSEAMVDSVAAFARTGDPNAPGMSGWSAYDPSRDNVQSLNIPASASKDGYGAANNCALWDTINVY